MPVGTSQTRIIDSENYDECCDVLKWLRVTVGVDDLISMPDEDPKALFYLFDGDEDIPITSGTMFVWDTVTDELTIHAPKPTPVVFTLAR